MGCVWTSCRARQFPRSKQRRPPHPIWHAVMARPVFTRASSFATARAWKSSAKCSTPTGRRGKLNEIREAAYGYLALTLDTLHELQRIGLDLVGTCTSLVESGLVFDRHDFAFVSGPNAEMAALIVSGCGLRLGHRTRPPNAFDELVALIRPDANKKSVGDLFDEAKSPSKYTPPPITITCKPGDSLDHIADGTIDAVVMDPSLLRQRHVCGVVGFLLCLAQAHGRSCFP